MKIKYLCSSYDNYDDKITHTAHGLSWILIVFTLLNSPLLHYAKSGPREINVSLNLNTRFLMEQDIPIFTARRGNLRREKESETTEYKWYSTLCRREVL